jgi:hypothetical protein
MSRPVKEADRLPITRVRRFGSLHVGPFTGDLESLVHAKLPLSVGCPLNVAACRHRADVGGSSSGKALTGHAPFVPSSLCACAARSTRGPLTRGSS